MRRRPRFDLAALAVSLSLWGQPASAAEATPAAAPEPRPKIGLVLSGGGARGGAHIGVLEVLEELRVPVDIIVGTSAGSIVGAAYASGMSLQELEKQMSGLSTATLFRDVDRTAVPLRRKVDDYGNFIGPEVGVSLDGLALPKGAVSGVSLEAVLRRLTRLQRSSNFDQLPIRFRAIATDLASSEMVVIDHGNLAQAVRASMAVPAAVTPVVIEGRLLVDGGLVRNLPVDVARAMGADIVIAINIGTPLLKREEISSLVSVSDQMLRIMTNANVERSLKELKPDDVLITPTLDHISSADFDELGEASAQGAAAARALAPRLAALSLAPAEYAALQQQRVLRAAGNAETLDDVRVVGTRRVNPEVIQAAIDTRAGTEFDAAVADADLKRIYGRGDFEAVNYTIVDEPGTGKVFTVEVEEKAWGPNYLRFGLGLSSDFEGNNFFRLQASHRWTWLNALGAEWRNDIQIGQTDLLRSEWYQPLTPRQRLFVAPRLELWRDPLDVYDEDGLRLARFRREVYGGGIDLGVPLGTSAELRAGLLRGRVRMLTDTSLVPGSVLIPDAELGGVLARLRFDTLDNANFPRSGMAGEIRLYRSEPGLGASDTYTKANLLFNAALARGPHSLQLGLRAGGSVDGRDLPDYETHSLGGFLQLSGYKTGQLVGTELRFARLVYNYRLSGPALLDGGYVGASAEVGKIGDSRLTLSGNPQRQGYSLYVAYDTPLGPVYLAYGRSGSGDSALYFYLGQP
ncbi:patatin-like phospholipase family protein [Rivibacter subsaxonicus]|uniref:NTE family protein n=1 Tax=Rivibacter subsaxonicus TaxID=457575 RepID=A0A4Q7VDP0_9BURK|nr:patatin-like phospholipase family protein [Rivibacter subsaxonicus]RZT93880.1 NTE family protein [Rivibacter subsaxonicus]